MLPTKTCEKCAYKWLPREEKPKKCPRCGYRLPEEYPEKYPRLWGSGLSSDYPFPSQRLPALPEDYAKALQDQKIAVDQRDLDNLHNLDHNILHEVLREQFQAFQTPVPSDKKHAEIAKTLNMNQLRNAEEDAKIEIERRQKGIEFIETQYLSVENAARVDNGVSILIRRPCGSESFHVGYGKNYEEFTDLMREKAAVLKEVEAHYRSVTAVYAAELNERASRSPAIIAAAVEEAKALIKEAEKLPKVIEKSVECDKMRDTPDTPGNRKSVEKYIESVERFKQLELKYYGLKDRLLEVIAPEQVTDTLPQFPKAAVVEISCSFAYLIEKVRNSQS